MLKASCVCFLLLMCSSITAQEIVKKFYDSDDQLVDESESLYYKIAHKSLTDGDSVKTFYTKTQALRSVEVVNKHGSRNGMMVMYHSNGNIKIKGKFESGLPSGDITSWYPDGKLQSVEFFVPVGGDGKLNNSGLIEYYDSLGSKLVTNGNGFCRCFFRVFSNPKILEQGKIAKGQRDSVWVGYRLDGTQYYEEHYRKGELEQGVSFDTAGNEYSYTELGQVAAPVEGMSAFYESVGSVLQYPKEARRRKIEGKVFVEFAVDTLGRLTDVKAIRGIGHGCDEEAVKAVMVSPAWKPGRVRGQPVRQRMVLPLSFKLG